jgi:hypothetical protein
MMGKRDAYMPTNIILIEGNGLSSVRYAYMLFLPFRDAGGRRA